MPEEEISFKDKSSFLFDVIKRYDHYIATTNFKVGLLMSFAGAIVLGLTIRIVLLGSPESSCDHLYYAAVFSSLLTISLSLAAIISLLRVVFPNTTTCANYKSIVFFGDVFATPNGAEGYAKNVEEATPEELLKDLSKQTYVIAGVVNEKFRLLKIAVKIFIYGVIPALAVSILLLISNGGG